MNQFTFKKTSCGWMPTLAPTTFVVMPEQFDPDLCKKADFLAQINGFRVRNGSVSAYRPRADSGYDVDNDVIVVIANNMELSPMAHEYYVFARENWDRVYKVGKDREPAKTVEMR